MNPPGRQQLALGKTTHFVLLLAADFPRANTRIHILQSMPSHAEAEDVGQLPQWLLQMLSQDERTGLFHLCIFPLAITLDMATCALPSTCETNFLLCLPLTIAAAECMSHKS